MSSHSHDPLTNYDKLRILLLIPWLLTRITIDFIRRTWARKSIKCVSIKRDLQRAFAVSLQLFSETQIRSILVETTGQAIARGCKRKCIEHTSILIEDTDAFPPTTLHFVDCRPEQAGRVCLYFHGGGYTLPLRDISYPLLQAQTAGMHLAVLEYSLAPEHCYPTQLAQGAAAMRFLLKYHSMCEIIISGDSAGGNLVLSLLAHLQKPHPCITPISPTKHGKQTKLLGALACSPRTSDEITYESINSNARIDYMSLDMLRRIIACWKPMPEVWAGASYGDSAFWKDIPVDKLLLLVGNDEIYRDEVVEAACLMDASEDFGSPKRIVVCPYEVHMQGLIDAALGINDGHMLNECLAWLQSFREV